MLSHLLDLIASLQIDAPYNRTDCVHHRSPLQPKFEVTIVQVHVLRHNFNIYLILFRFWRMLK